MNPVKSLISWWRGPTDSETLASEAEGHDVHESLQTIRHSQANVGKQAGGSLVAAPTPDVLKPGSEHDSDFR